ncbi:MAG TPA: dehydrogenase [Bacteroidales bacterium]|nr:dehydrogenase [Bacteroidales bacterium]HOM39933.1 dehydrogenase [Bacteroidales bacterium]HOU30117.1 dehydrogenase [Bacteroidales bacterium]HPP92319.1 dehydrogenase [Bacteroidales bacterium]HQK70331.1 dehydrogenase [Bacteroidales bacterium]
MIVRSKAPLRLGLAGGGTDVSPYSDIFGGAILNASINLYAYASIEPGDNGEITLRLEDKNLELRYPLTERLEPDGNMDLIKGVYNRIIREFRLSPQPFRLSAYVDAPPGSGLGSSSTLVVAVLGAFAEWFRLPLGEYDLAWLACDIERNDLGMAGGKQDQYAATFGGVNFMEFYKNDKVIVNPLRIKEQILNELSNNIVLYYTETSRISSSIIENQQRNVKEGVSESVEAMHMLKELAISMKEALLKGELDSLGELLDNSWNYKKKMAGGITNPHIDTIYDTALKAGATGGKISGAGGGGYMFFYCPRNTRYNVIRALKQFGGHEQKYEFTKRGLETWTI